jgi:hypothetical protein
VQRDTQSEPQSARASVDHPATSKDMAINAMSFIGHLPSPADDGPMVPLRGLAHKQGSAAKGGDVRRGVAPSVRGRYRVSMSDPGRGGGFPRCAARAPRGAAGTCGWLAVVWCASALAQTPPIDSGDRTRAEEHFLLGVALMQQENWDGAIVEFTQSLELYATRSALFNLAQCKKAVHDYLAARELLRHWLEQYGATAPEEERQNVDATIAEVSRFLGRIRVEAPRGAAVRMDGRVVGTAPLVEPVEAAVGVRTLEAQLDGCDDARVDVSVVAGEEVVASLQPVPRTAAVPVAPPLETPPAAPASPLAGVPLEELETYHQIRTAGWLMVGIGFALGVASAGLLGDAASQDHVGLEWDENMAGMVLGGIAIPTLVTSAVLLLWPEPEPPSAVGAAFGAAGSGLRLTISF